MHRQQIIGVLYEMVHFGHNVTIVVDKLADIPEILDVIETWDGHIEHAKLEIRRAHGAESVTYSGRRITFASARSPRGLRGRAPSVIVVDETSPGIHLALPDIKIIQRNGAERVPMIH